MNEDLASRFYKYGGFELFPMPRGPQRSSYDEPQRNLAVGQFMEQHFPADYARDTVLKAPNVSFYDKARLMDAIESSAYQTEPSGNLSKMEHFLPALVGAGLGYTGAALAAPIFGLSPMQKNVFRIGAGALGAVLNTYGR